ncbi:MAG: ABC transporter ATP-binding protein [Chloroflexi bacterium]|nr:ABC transporter ATP-binding protein [Chloroflexota bacterium]
MTIHAVVEAHGLTKRFGTFTAVDRVDLHVAEGEVLALLGPNGAGKTTTVRCLAAILRPTAGQARIAGHDTVAEAQTVRHLVGLLTEFPGLYQRMRPPEYLAFFGQLHEMQASHIRQRSEQLMRQFGLWDARDHRMGEFSKGMQQKMALIRAMIHDPHVLFLDEPTSAMDPQSAKQVRDAIAALRREGRTILLCTHNLAEAETLADRIAIIRRGKIVALGTPAELKHRLLGDPLTEVRLTQSIDGFLSRVTDLVEIVDHGETWFRYRAARAQEVNPRIVRRLTEAGHEVVAIGELEQHLETVYLRIVEEERAGNE